ncbi:lipopolysaccharide biosynthesis protein [Enterovirga aerilata]|uniref:Lipopolysaccharide biosynthesis protein n=1 Tax=Enterovirga aerilata TaxID=2730920 RepID=A0A849IE95_9HYPH|nr:lipopolysaccharide biosynthesis protein [Enterovirga sp. DB1703]NNM74545.1 lipopolysaccharide biosynthesis protein [Enterovirga sp. DB1703]
MSVEPITSPVRVPAAQRAQKVSESLSEAARRLRFATGGRSPVPTTHRARRNRQIARLVTWLGFLAFVAVPTLASTLYFGLIASDQYVAEARFAVRSGAMAGLDALSSLTGIPSIQVIQDTQVVTNYIESRALVELLAEKADLRGRYSVPEADFYARLNPDKPIERIVKYWNSMSHVAIEMPGGIVVLTVRAFRPDDAVALANAVVDASEQLVNDMNDRARRDAVADAERELQLAAGRLSQARAALEVARNQEGIIDAPTEAKKTDALISALRAQQLEFEQQYAVARKSVSDDAPQMRNLRARIDATARQVEKLQAELTTRPRGDTAGPVLTSSMTRLSALELERQIAQTQYTNAAAALERARLASLSKQIYLTSFVRPAAAEEARYPRRALNISVTLGAGLLAWVSFLGLANVARARIGR